MPALLVSTALDVAWLVHSKRQSVGRWGWALRSTMGSTTANDPLASSAAAAAAVVIAVDRHGVSETPGIVLEELLMGVLSVACETERRNMRVFSFFAQFYLPSRPKTRPSKTALGPCHTKASIRPLHRCCCIDLHSICVLDYSCRRTSAPACAEASRDSTAAYSLQTVFCFLLRFVVLVRCRQQQQAARWQERQAALIADGHTEAARAQCEPPCPRCSCRR